MMRTPPDLPFDQLQRYRAVARVLERVAPGNPRVLDVGGAAGRLADLYPCRLTVADRLATPGGVMAEGQLLPFPPDSFDVAVSCDALEHVVPSGRASFVAELLRVSRRWVVLAAPFHDPDVVAAELALHELLRGVRGGPYPFLAEHLEHGLPRLDEVRQGFASYGAAVADLPNGYLPRWLPMMAITFFLDADPRYAALRPVVTGLYDATFGPHDACAPCYRHVLLADKEGIDPEPHIEELRAVPGAAPKVELGYVLALIAELRHHAAGGLPSRERPASDALGAAPADPGRMEAENRRLEEVMRSLKERVRQLEDETAGSQEALARDRDAAQARAAQLAAELALAQDRIDALRVHAENLAGIVERLSARPIDRLLRRLTG